MGDQPQPPPSILNQPVIPRSTEEARRLINLPWMPPPPTYDAHTSEANQICHLSRDEYLSLFDSILANNMIFVTITLVMLCFGFYWLYTLILEGVQQMFQSQFHKSVVNATTKED